MDLRLFKIGGTWTGHIPEKEARGVISIKKQSLRSVYWGINPPPLAPIFFAEPPFKSTNCPNPVFR